MKKVLIKHYVAQILSGNYKKDAQSKLWNGKATERIGEVISQFIAQ